jgi:glycosyltransferase involved in cell wall biosynthesis
MLRQALTPTTRSIVRKHRMNERIAHHNTSSRAPAMLNALSVSGESTCAPVVTIAIPTFNRASWLADCVRAALSQTYHRFEILVSDNASTDETEEILKGFTDERLRVIRQEANIGLLPNWNACLAGARGDYIVFVSDDDWIAPWLLERCVNLVEREPKISIVVAVSNIHSTLVGRTWPGVRSQCLRTGIWDGADILLEYLTDQITVPMCSILIRTDALRAQGGFALDLPHAADVGAWAPLLLRGKAGLVNEACATYYLHSACETSKLPIGQLLRDGWKVADLISNLANHSIDDLQMRRRLQLQSRRCFSRRALILISMFRRDRGSLLEALSIIWRYRRELSHIDMISLARLGRQIAIIFCPRVITDLCRQFKGILAGGAQAIRRRRSARLLLSQPATWQADEPSPAPPATPREASPLG